MPEEHAYRKTPSAADLIESAPPPLMRPTKLPARPPSALSSDGTVAGDDAAHFVVNGADDLEAILYLPNHNPGAGVWFATHSL